MVVTKDKLVTQLRNDLNGIASKDIEPQEANGIVANLWVNSGFNKDLCTEAILSLGGKHPSVKIKDFRRFGLSFLKKLSASKSTTDTLKPTLHSEDPESTSNFANNEVEETPESAAKLMESAFFLETKLANKDAKSVAANLISVFYNSCGRDNILLQEVVSAVQDQTAKRFLTEAAELISKPRHQAKPNPNIFFILVIIALVIIIGLMLAP